MSRPIQTIIEKLDLDRDGIADDCEITGGTITGVTLDNVVIGGSTAVAGSFTTVDASGITTLSSEIVLEGQTIGGGVVSVTDATVSLTAALHAGKIVVLNRAAGVTVTLPAATATGDVYTVVIGTAASSNANIIETSATSEHMTGQAIGADDDTEGQGTAHSWNCETSDDTITMDGTATGGVKGDIIIIRDFEATNFTVDAKLTQSGASEATPFSAAVS